MNWVITGGCGFLGVNLVRTLRSAGGHRIRVVDDLSVGTRDDLALCGPVEATDVSGIESMDRTPDLELVVGDVCDSDLATAVVAGADVVVHLAANTGVAQSVQRPARDCHVNIVGTLTYLEACRVRGVPRFVLASSGAVVGEAPPPLNERITPHPISPYGVSKLAGEAYCFAYSRTLGVEAVALRFGNVYGPWSSSKQSVVALFLRQMISGTVRTIHGSGEQTRDFVFVGDVAEAILRAAVAERAGGRVFHIASGVETSVSVVSNMLERILEDLGVPFEAAKSGSLRVGDVARSCAEISAAASGLVWEPKTSLAEGLTRTAQWFVAEGPGATDR